MAGILATPHPSSYKERHPGERPAMALGRRDDEYDMAGSNGGRGGGGTSDQTSFPKPTYHSTLSSVPTCLTQEFSQIDVLGVVPNPGA